MSSRFMCDDPDVEVLSESALAQAQATIQNAMDQAQISRADLARSMERSRSYVSRMLSGSHNLTIKTMARATLACGYEVKFGLTATQWNPIFIEPEQLEFRKAPVEGALLLVNGRH